MAENTQACFVISPIGPEGSNVRNRADQILRHVITPVAAACGFDTVRADHISEPGLITAQVIQHIIDDPLVIADLTGSNPNVFYELAIRHAIRKPLVQIIQKDEKIPFDVAGMRTIPVDHQDLDSVEEAKGEIEKQIKAVLSKKPGEIESPISVSVELHALRHKDFKAYFNTFYEARATDLSLPNLLFLAVAGHFTFPVTHGEEGVRLNREWRHDQGEWESRSSFMETLGLLNRNSSREVVRSHLGTAILYLALKDPRFAEVAGIMRSDRKLANEWGL